MSEYRNQLEDYLKTLDIKAERVLDVGGLAKPVKDRVKSWDVKEYEILDLPEYDLNAEEDDTMDSLDFNNKWQLLNFNEKRADIVFCLEVMEYVFNPFQAINNLWRTVKQNGILYITFPFSYPHHNPAGTDMLRYTEWGARKLLETEFRIEEIIYRVDRSGLLKEFYAADGMRASKEYAHHDATGFIFKCKKI